MAHAGTWSKPPFVDRETLTQLSRRSVWRWLFAVTREWGVIAASMWVCHAWREPLVWALAILLIGSRQHALAVLVHDAGHFLVHRSKAVNDALANYLAAYWLFFPVQGYRTNHLKHHRLLETPADPERLTIDAYPREFTFPMPARRLCWLCLRDLIGGSIKPMSTLIDYVWAVPEGRWPHIWRMAVLHLMAFGVAIATDNVLIYLVLWVVPAFSSFTLFFRLRTAAEHSGIGAPQARYARNSVEPLVTTRTFLSDPVTRYLLSPYNISYHTEHHLYPMVPGFNLRKLRQHLEKTPDYARRSHVTFGFRNLWRELTAPPEGSRCVVK